MRLLALALALLLLPSLALAAPGEPRPVLTLEEPEASWEGAHVVAGAGVHAAACVRLTCERFPFHASFPVAAPPTPGLHASIEWPSAEDDFDLYLYDGWGLLVTSGTQRGSSTEGLRVPELKPGDYTLVVVPVLVTESAYVGSVRLLPME